MINLTFGDILDKINAKTLLIVAEVIFAIIGATSIYNDYKKSEVIDRLERDEKILIGKNDYISVDKKINPSKNVEIVEVATVKKLNKQDNKKTTDLENEYIKNEFNSQLSFVLWALLLIMGIKLMGCFIGYMGDCCADFHDLLNNVKHAVLRSLIAFGGIVYIPMIWMNWSGYTVSPDALGFFVVMGSFFTLVHVECMVEH